MRLSIRFLYLPHNCTVFYLHEWYWRTSEFQFVGTGKYILIRTVDWFVWKYCMNCLPHICKCISDNQSNEYCNCIQYKLWIPNSIDREELSLELEFRIVYTDTNSFLLVHHQINHNYSERAHCYLILSRSLEILFFYVFWNSSVRQQRLLTPIFATFPAKIDWNKQIWQPWRRPIV